jgi:HPt (histidine-containing phosphotransfer) domain-containing protein
MEKRKPETPRLRTMPDEELDELAKQMLSNLADPNVEELEAHEERLEQELRDSWEKTVLEQRETARQQRWINRLLRHFR